MAGLFGNRFSLPVRDPKLATTTTAPPLGGPTGQPALGPGEKRISPFGGGIHRGWTPLPQTGGVLPQAPGGTIPRPVSGPGPSAPPPVPTAASVKMALPTSYSPPTVSAGAPPAAAATGTDLTGGPSAAGNWPTFKDAAGNTRLMPTPYNAGNPDPMGKAMENYFSANYQPKVNAQGQPLPDPYETFWMMGAQTYGEDAMKAAGYKPPRPATGGGPAGTAF